MGFAKIISNRLYGLPSNPQEKRNIFRLDVSREFSTAPALDKVAASWYYLPVSSNKLLIVKLIKLCKRMKTLEMESKDGG